MTLLASLDQLREEKKGYFKEHITQLVAIHSLQSSAEVKKKRFQVLRRTIRDAEKEVINFLPKQGCLDQLVGTIHISNRAPN